MNHPAPAESSLTPSPSGDGRGALQAPQTASGAGSFVARVVRVPLERPDDAAWRDLVALAREGAQLANGMIAAWWAEAHGWQPKPDQSSAIVQFKGRLSGDAYVAIAGEAKGVWQRLRTRILRRDQRLPAFASDRALVVRGQYAGGKGGVRIVRTADTIEVRLLLYGKDFGGWHVFPAWSLALKKDRYLSTLLDHLASGAYRCSKVTLQIDQRRRKLYALMAYDRPVRATSGLATGTVGPLEEDDSCLVRTLGATLDISRFVWEIRTKKDHYDGIVRRHRATMGRGPGWRRAYRRSLPPTYQSWATGRLHQLSARVITWLIEQRTGRVRILPMGNGDWPAHQFTTMLSYKAEQAGMQVDVGEPPAENTDPATERARTAPAKKDATRAGQVRRAVRTLKDDLKKGTG